ncbi:hypothetical protein G7081_01710 [Vagococcus coleopterorum]|uniref:Cell fate regulator YmcA, YheA/YmcA/DUF963 family (Controls sporulation, competence, biofilm development) n=1 Tax=Vagococcus coleopterorum TaxID=2714946 RepID=A0A6G8ALR1_9ENTE|nr:YlbF family regulator [Vagococcus coleopterorum]QIL45899.1 hypothetical protein G7081_01710 [Vagococcus coleopterorum]
MTIAEEFEKNPQVADALANVLEKLEANSVIKEFRDISKKVEDHEGLRQLTERIKVEQKNAVQCAHYGKPEAEKLAKQEADRLTEEFDQHPLVIRYREKLVEANDLLQHLTNKIERDFNDQLEEKLDDLDNLGKEAK